MAKRKAGAKAAASVDAVLNGGSDEQQVEEQQEEEDSAPGAAAPPSKKKKKAGNAAVAQDNNGGAAGSRNGKNAAAPKAKSAKKAAGGTPSKAAGKSAETEEIEEEQAGLQEVSLFSVVSKRAAALTVVVDDWIKRYEADPQSAVVELINFVIESAGWSGRITREQYVTSSDELDQLIGRVITADYITTGAADYPLVSKKPGPLRKFKANFVEFWLKLVTKLPNRVLYPPASATDGAGGAAAAAGGGLLDTLTACLGSFSDLTARPFRHTATVSGLAVIGGLIRIASRVRKESDVASRHESLERRRGGGASNKQQQQQQQQLQERAGTTARLQRQVTSLEAAMLDMFRAIFVRRYRDTVPDIRQECIRALGEWLRDYTALFLQDEYLKYIGWSLNDRAPEVRGEALEALARLFEHAELLPHLEQFFERFEPRLLAMARDREPQVQVRLVRLAGVLSRAQLLSEQALGELVALTSDESASVRLEAAQFVRDHVLAHDSAATAGGEGGEGGGDGQQQVRSLVQLVVEHTRTPTMPHYIVDALWGPPERPDSLPALTDWAALADLLSTDEPPLLPPRDDDDQQQPPSAGEGDEQEQQREARRQDRQQQAQCVLARVLASSVKKAAGLPIVPKAKHEPEATQAAKDDRLRLLREASSALAGRLRALLERFAAQSDVLEELLELPPLLLSPSSAQLDAWLGILRKTLTNQTEPSVLAAAARSLRQLASADRAAGREKAQATGRQAGEEIAQQLLRAVKTAAPASTTPPTKGRGGRGRRKSSQEAEEDEQPQTQDEEGVRRLDWATLGVVVERAAALAAQIDCSEVFGTRVEDAVRVVLSHPSGDLAGQDKAIATALRLLYQVLFWTVLRLTGAGEAVEEQSVAAAVELRDELFAQVETRLADGGDGRSEAERAALLVACDACVLCAVPPPPRSPLRRLLGYQPSEQLQLRLSGSFEAQMDALGGLETPANAAATKLDPEFEERKVALLAALARPLVTGAVSERLAPLVLQHELQPGPSVRDLVRLVLHRLRQRAGGEEWRLVHLTLRHFFERRPAAADDESEADFTAVAEHHARFKELAARFSASYLPLQNPKSPRDVREELLASLGRLVQEGVLYALETPDQFAFLDGLAKLLPKLPRDRADAFRDFVQSEVAKLDDDARGQAEKSGSAVKAFIDVLRRMSSGERPPAAAGVGDKRKRRVARTLELEMEGADAAAAEDMSTVVEKPTKGRKRSARPQEARESPAKAAKAKAGRPAKAVREREAESRAKKAPQTYAEPEEEEPEEQSADEIVDVEDAELSPIKQVQASPAAPRARRVSRATLPQAASKQKRPASPAQVDGSVSLKEGQARMRR